MEDNESELARARTEAGLTQEDLARLLRMDVKSVRNWESGRNKPQAKRRHEIAEHLSVSLADLEERIRRTAASRTAPRPKPPGALDGQSQAGQLAAETLALEAACGQAYYYRPAVPHTPEAAYIRARIPILRRVLDSHDIPEDGPVRPVDELNSLVAATVDKRLQSDYRVLAAEVPPLLSELHRGFLNCARAEKSRFARLLFQVYRAADAVADKYGYYDLSARIIGLLSTAASDAEDELLDGSASYVRAEIFFASEDLSAGRRMLERAADRIDRAASETAAATYGALHMRAAVMAGRAGEALRARDHIAEAQDAARRVNEGIHLGTAFGTASVRIHHFSLAAEICDISAAFRLAAGWRPGASMPAERRSHFYIDLARVYNLADERDNTIDALRAALRIAPEHVRAHPQVGEMVEQLRRTTPRASNDAMNSLDRELSSGAPDR
ncbi:MULTISPECIES: helix-turn-helix transcriptional regulator [Actinomycetes]|uniref:helix-turn-helix domain-containing protein n=1 Tax=Actinomycetes TaxID=1760 RepID=UPI0001B556CE|nr:MULTISPECIES: helix-turn-helix transcriptional regulator [Actinomycetes]